MKLNPKKWNLTIILKNNYIAIWFQNNTFWTEKPRLPLKKCWDLPFQGNSSQNPLEEYQNDSGSLNLQKIKYVFIFLLQETRELGFFLKKNLICFSANLTILETSISKTILNHPNVETEAFSSSHYKTLFSLCKGGWMDWWINKMDEWMDGMDRWGGWMDGGIRWDGMVNR